MPTSNTAEINHDDELIYTSLENVQLPQCTSYFESACGIDVIVPYNSDMMFVKNIPVDNQIFLSIIEQPTDTFRYRYKSEKGSHGGIKGEHYLQTKKCFPKIKLENCKPSDIGNIIIKVTLYTNESDPKPHVYELTGKKCDNGVCVTKLDKDCTATFSSLAITTKKKEEVFEILMQRKEKELKGVCEKTYIEEEVQKEMKNYSFDSAKLCFEALFSQDETPVCEKVFSNPVNNQKSSAAGDLRINRLSKVFGKCSGGEEVFLLCEKIKKDDIKVLFYEKDDENGVIWCDYGEFNPSADVHYQVAIVFKTPKYRQNVEKTVCVQLFRPSDERFSEPRLFNYIPDENDMLGNDRKRKRCGSEESEVHLSTPDILNLNASLPLSSLKASGSFPSEEEPIPESFEDLLSDPDIMKLLPSEFSSTESFPLGGIFSQDIMEGQMDTDVVGFNSNQENSAINAVGQMDDSYVSCDGIIGRVTNQIKFLSLDKETNKTVPNSKAKRAKQNSKDFMDGVKELLKNRSLVYKQDKNGNSALHVAILEQNRNLSYIVKILAIVSENYVNQKNKFKQTPLHLAVKGNRCDVLCLLLLKGGNPNIVDGDGNTCLHLAAQQNFVKCMKMLMVPSQMDKLRMHKIKDINILNFDGMSALHLAVVNNATDCLKFLLDAKADVNLPESKCGQTPLHLAIDHACLIHDILKQPGIDLSAEDFRGFTAFHLACIKKGKSFDELSAEIGSDEEKILKFLESVHQDERVPDSRGGHGVDYNNQFADSNSDLDSDNEILEQASLEERFSSENYATAACGEIISAKINSDEKKPNLIKIEVELFKYLDSDHNWQIIADFIDMDKELCIKFSSEASPGKSVVRSIQNLYGEGYLTALIELLEIAGLNEGVRILRRC